MIMLVMQTLKKWRLKVKHLFLSSMLFYELHLQKIKRSVFLAVINKISNIGEITQI